MRQFNPSIGVGTDMLDSQAQVIRLKISQFRNLVWRYMTVSDASGSGKRDDGFCEGRGAQRAEVDGI